MYHFRKATKRRTFHKYLIKTSEPSNFSWNKIVMFKPHINVKELPIDIWSNKVYASVSLTTAETVVLF